MRTTTISRVLLGGIVGATSFALVGVTPAVGTAQRVTTPGSASASVAGSLVDTVAGTGTPTQAELDALPFRNPDLPLAARIKDLLSRLTPDEEISLLHQFPLPVPRLGIGQFRAGTEAVHGLAWTTSPVDGAVHTATATTFPQAVGLASTWDTGLIQQVGGVVGDEARGYNAQDPSLWGLNLWAPVVNLLRDPRWGRNEEGYSEDPTLTGAISTAYGKGMEGDDPFYLKTAPTLKHYLAYNNETNRDTSSSVVPPRVLHEYDEQAFEPAISADAATGVMASYNLVNGRPATVDPTLDSTVRSWTDKTLFNVSDAAAPTNLTGSEQYYATQAEADAALVKAGLDSMTVNDNNPQPTIAAVKEALAKGLLTQADVDKAASDELSIRFRLGEFDPDGGPYASIGADAVDNAASRALARKTADESQVLLKNAKQTLPLDAKKTTSVAVVGPLEDTLYTDWYGGKQPYSVTPLDGITERLGKGATVRSTEGVDRITLRDAATGKYVVGGSGAAGANLAATSSTAGATAQFDVFDWGDGVVTLRSAANAKTVGFNWTGFANDQDQPNGWYVQQQFTIEDRPDGNVVLKYAGYESSESWAPSHTTPYVTVNADGMLVLGAATADQATELSRDVVTSGTAEAVKAAKKSDAAVVVVGTMPFINGREAHDRTDMNLAEGQEALVDAVLKANPNTVVVLESSYPQTIDRLQKKAPAILWTTHAGQETGHAVADVLFGDVNPAGRVTQTWPTSTAKLPADLNDYDIITSGQTYLYDKTTPLYAFGHGLSYTSFRYSNLKVADRKITAKGTIKVTVDVTNTGRRDGDEVVQLYTHQRSSRDATAIQALRTFERVSIKAGHTKKVTLEVPAKDLRHWDVTRDKWVVETSVYDVQVGGASDDIRARSTVTVLGEAIPARNLARSTQAQDYDAQHGTTLVDTTKESGTSVESTGAGSWVAYRDVDLNKGAGTFTASVARAAAGTGHVEIRLGSPHGKLLGTASVASTGDKYTSETVRATLKKATGRQDVYLVFDSPVRVSTFRITR
ncbi:glycoside hydrolase family 3 protein [Luteimicrobium subarcticum]|uniref:Exo-alpha-(1->6)-L-arabinopyranosidase n=1 Tax=Luteimicrobium subarcticum TaxID=620910 RepID=A0A2M8WV37_9MICO|nr:glycoside hydrolase family 3 protein [Luteimicrobium subarcticum]PJI94797.1 exo-1,4-beta-glucosidase [Luteimicrobium subarcticum]